MVQPTTTPPPLPPWSPLPPPPTPATPPPPATSSGCLTVDDIPHIVGVVANRVIASLTPLINAAGLIPTDPVIDIDGRLDGIGQPVIVRGFEDAIPGGGDAELEAIGDQIDTANLQASLIVNVHVTRHD